jgi:protein-tyrosine-phosphatase
MAERTVVVRVAGVRFSPFTLLDRIKKRMKNKRILFVCKHNVFRSKIAEAYFKKINRNKNFIIDSAGIIKSDMLTKTEKEIVALQRKIARDFGLNVKGISKPLRTSILSKQDLIVIVADDVQKDIFNNSFYLKPDLKIIRIKIPDIKKEDNPEEFLKEKIGLIIKKMDKLYYSLGNKK